MPIKAIVDGAEKEITRIPVLGHDIETATGTNSITFNTSSDRVIECDIVGNGQQTGTPAPDSPIMPDFCGVRTANLLDADTAYGTYKQSDGTYKASIGKFYTTHIKPFTSNDIGKTYTFYAYIVSMDSTIQNIRVVANVNGTRINGNFLSAAGATKVSFIVETIDDYLHFGYGAGVNDITVKDIMLNAGSAALPYEPYGWAEKITCAGQTVPVYLGQVSTVRAIYKTVFDGSENWKFSTYPYLEDFTRYRKNYLRQKINICVCSHLQTSANVQSGDLVTPDTCCFNIETINGLLYYKDTSVSSLASFKSWLQQQYAAGTPVTLWYVLANEEIAIVNEPLCKIGDYADEFSSSDAGVTIPTIKGTNTLTVDTTLPPSQTTVKYLGIDNVYKDTWEVRDNHDRLLWYREDTLTGISSISYKGYGIPLKSMKIVGNGVQNGTPSPDNIIMPDFCGERTRNLFDPSAVVIGKYIDANGEEAISSGTGEVILNHSGIIPCESGVSYTVNIIKTVGIFAVSNAFCWFRSDNTLIARDVFEISQAADKITATYTAPNDAAYLIINFRGTHGDTCMLNSGSTALPYEPFGYKLHITNAGQTVPVYLGEVPTVRRVMKRVLTGNENWASWSSGQSDVERYYYKWGKSTTSDYGLICTHLPFSRSDGNFEHVRLGGAYREDFVIFISKTIASTAADFKSYLAAQYAAGTPVTVWYILAEPETGIVNEPLAKIGDYADELIIDPNITPQTGTNTLTVDTTLSPSSVSITGHIKQE